MKDKQRQALGEWLMEIAALLGVFPPLDLVVREGRFDVAMVLPLVCAILLAFIGLYLIGKD